MNTESKRPTTRVIDTSISFEMMQPVRMDGAWWRILTIVPYVDYAPLKDQKTKGWLVTFRRMEADDANKAREELIRKFNERFT